MYPVSLCETENTFIGSEVCVVASGTSTLYDVEQFKRNEKHSVTVYVDKQIAGTSELLIDQFASSVDVNQFYITDLEISDYEEASFFDIFNTIPQDLNIDEETIKFCLEENISNEISNSIGLIDKHFDDIHNWDIELNSDPETNEKWLVLEIDVNGDISDILSSYDNYILEFISTIPTHNREKIRLAYNIL